VLDIEYLVKLQVLCKKLFKKLVRKSWMLKAPTHVKNIFTMDILQL